ncbi:MAG: ABC transporter permease [Clostridiaceae bacterium]|jgi:ABC-type lipoprotein release transport system permease subunit|nr:ABC transporter permease [Clostridiaceae bacterium]
MKLAFLSLKSATVKLWRSVTLGFFIFMVAFVMLFANAFITAAKNKVENVILNGFTGHIQLRSAGSREGDMVVQYTPGWDLLKPVEPGTLHTIREILTQYPDVHVTRLCRRAVSLEANGKKQETMLIGIDHGMDSVKEAFLLSEGAYPSLSGNNEILLTKEQASLLGLGVGDTVKTVTKNRYGLKSEAELKVVGIGDYIMLSLFSYQANYTQLSTVQYLSGYSAEETTDILLFLPDTQDLHGMVKALSADLSRNGLDISVTAEEKLTSEDLIVADISFDEDEDEQGILLSTTEEMGEAIKAVTGTLFVVLNIFLVFLMIIVSVLIFNLVYMTGIERYREIGTFRAIGFSKPQVIRIFMGEIIAVSIISTILGILAGTLIMTLLNRLSVSSPLPFLNYIMGETLYLELNPYQMLINLLVILGFSVLSSFLPAYRACAVDPAEAIRTV